YWHRDDYRRLAAELRGRGLIDIDTWPDADAARIQKILERGGIRSRAEYRLATEYRDFLDDEELLDRVNELLSWYEAAGSRPVAGSPSNKSETKRRAGTSKLSAEDLVLLDTLRRSAIASFEYAAGHSKKGAQARTPMARKAETWRTIEIDTVRDLKDMEQS